MRRRYQHLEGLDPVLRPREPHEGERDEEIRRLRAEGWTHRALAVHFELSRIRIMRICQRRTQAPSEGRNRGLSLRREPAA